MARPKGSKSKKRSPAKKPKAVKTKQVHTPRQLVKILPSCPGCKKGSLDNSITTSNMIVRATGKIRRYRQCKLCGHKYATEEPLYTQGKAKEISFVDD